MRTRSMKLAWVTLCCGLAACTVDGGAASDGRRAPDERATVSTGLSGRSSHRSDPSGGADPGSETGIDSAMEPGFWGTISLGEDIAQLSSGGMNALYLLSVRDLIVRLELPRSAEPITWTEITILAPDGSPFYSIRTPFSMDPMVKLAEDPLAPHPADVLHPTLAGDRIVLDVVVPIAGTDFVRKARPGTWKIRAQVERNPLLVLSAPIVAKLARR